MAVENLKSTHISNATATPVVLNTAPLGAGAQLHESAGTVTSAAAASSTSTYRMCRVPSNARISQVLLSNGAAGATGAADVGVYETNDNGGAAVDAGLFGSAVAITAAQNHLDVTYESGQYTLAESEKPLWEVLGKTKDTQREYDIVITLTADVVNATAMNLKVRFAK